MANHTPHGRSLKDALAAIGADEVIALARDLVRIDSTNPPGNEQAVAAAILNRARQAGLQARLEHVSDRRANARVCLEGTRRNSPRLLLCGHLDTVVVGQAPWQRDPFGAEIVDGVLWGRGAVDMKGGLAAMLGALCALKRSGASFPGDVELVALVGEEVDCAGARHFVDMQGMEGAAWIVIGEPTGLRVAVSHKGCVRVRVTSHGISAHAARPELGRNAITEMGKLLVKLSALELPGPAHMLLSPPTVAPTIISGGSAVNVIPDRCELELDVRTVPGQSREEVLRGFRQLFATEFREERSPSVEVVYHRDPVQTPIDDRLITAMRAACRQVLVDVESEVIGLDFFTDGSVLQPQTGVPTVIFGPGDIALMHQVDERVGIADVVRAAHVLTALPFFLWEPGLA